MTFVPIRPRKTGFPRQFGDDEQRHGQLNRNSARLAIALGSHPTVAPPRVRRHRSRVDATIRGKSLTVDRGMGVTAATTRSSERSLVRQTKELTAEVAEDAEISVANKANKATSATSDGTATPSRYTTGPGDDSDFNRYPAFTYR